MDTDSINGFRLSPQQRHLWSVQNENIIDHAQVGVLIEGRLDVGSLKEALQLLVDRHEILRTTFRTFSTLKLPLQVVKDHDVLNYREVDLRDLSVGEQDSRVSEVSAQEKQAPFDLEHGPVMRAVLLALSPQSNLLLITLPALCADSWTLHNIVREAADAYTTGAGRRDVPVEHVQYAQFSEWQNELSEGVEFEEGKQYWKEQQAAREERLSLPFDADCSNQNGFLPNHHCFALDRDLIAEVAEISRHFELPLHAFFLACWHVLIWRLNGCSAVSIGYEHSGRTYDELSAAIGLFAKTLPAPIDFEENFRFYEVWRQAAQRVKQISEWQDYFSPEQADSFGQSRDSDSYIPIQFKFDECPASYQAEDLIFTIQEQYSNIGIFALKLNCQWHERSANLRLSFNGRKFSDRDIQRLAGQFQVLLRSAAKAPATEVMKLDILSQQERELLFDERHTIFPQDHCVHQIFELHATQTPGSIALSFEDVQLTYSQLNGKANQLAHFLRGKGAGPEVLVAICVDRSVDMIVGLLGILKSGGAYVPLDPTFPAERLAAMLELSGAFVLLTQSHLISRLPAAVSQVVCLDSDWSVIAQEPAINPTSDVSLEHVAYVSYTSGSTGKPKGVAIEHRQLLNYTLSIQRRLDLPPGASFGTVSTIAADLGNTSIYASLCSGGCLHVISWEQIFDAEALAAYFRQHPVDCLKIVPSHLKALLEGSDPKAVLPRRQLVLGGEAWDWELAGKLQALAPGCALLNHYGPTETTIGVLTYQVPTGYTPQFAATPPLGRPLDNIQVYILDSHLQPVPLGVAGELYLSGACVSRGYRDQPDATAEKFIPDPFSLSPGSRMYQTGDLARYLPDGTVEFLGRRDNQIKVRGFRVELNEIQSAIRQLPKVQDVIVLAHPDKSSGQRIVAYVIPESDNFSASDPKLWAEQIAEWKTVFDETHSELSMHQGATFNPLGWNSSYTGEPFPEAEIREQVEGTVQRILGKRPKKVLEIGCGTGLLLFAIAPHCDQYFGTDFSEEILAYTRRVASASGYEPPHVELLHRTADNFEGLLPESFDTVILNSVVQYFPSVEYLLRVIQSATKVVRPGGSIFIGDVRSLPLLRAFHASVQFERAADATSREQLQQLIAQQMERESELIIDPAFFYALPRQITDITSVEVSLKRGHYQNELTRFRYDVTLYVGTEPPTNCEAERLEWQQHSFTPHSLHDFLLRAEPEAVCVTGVPNARVLTDLHLVDLLADQTGPADVKAIREAIGQSAVQGIDPEAIWELQTELSYAIEIGWTAENAGLDCFDVFIGRKANDAGRETRSSASAAKTDHLRPWTDYANTPLQEKLARGFVAAMRSALEAQLPDHMLPSAFVLLQKFPLTHNGKVDFTALALADQMRPETERPFVAPRTSVETVVASVWAEVLRLDQIGVHDNFFELGGHSLLATQVLARLRVIFQANIPLRSFFEMPTVAGFSQAITTKQENPGQIERIAEILHRIVDMSDEAVREVL